MRRENDANTAHNRPIPMNCASAVRPRSGQCYSSLSTSDATHERDSAALPLWQFDSFDFRSMALKEIQNVIEGFRSQHHPFNSLPCIVTLLNQNEHMTKIILKQLSAFSYKKLIFIDRT